MDLNNGQSSSPRVEIFVLPERKNTKRRRTKKKKQFGRTINLEIVQASPEWREYTLLISTCTGFLQLRYQNMKNNEDSPFATHPTNIKAFFLSFCVYCFIPLAKAVFPTHCTRYSLIFSHLSLISGLLSSLSLLTIFSPSWLAKLLISIFLVSMSLILGRHWIKVIHQRLHKSMITAEIYAIDVFRRLMRRNLSNQRRPFVV